MLTKIPVVDTPTISVIVPAVFTLTLTDAPLNGAYPLPGVEAAETMMPPLGNWFWLISSSSIIRSVNPTEVIPVN